MFWRRHVVTQRSSLKSIIEFLIGGRVETPGEALILNFHRIGRRILTRGDVRCKLYIFNKRLSVLKSIVDCVRNLAPRGGGADLRGRKTVPGSEGLFSPLIRKKYIY